MSINRNSAAAGGDAVYGPSTFGAWVHFWQQADTFWQYVLAVIRGLFWPAWTVKDVFDALGHWLRPAPGRPGLDPVAPPAWLETLESVCPPMAIDRQGSAACGRIRREALPVRVDCRAVVVGAAGLRNHPTELADRYAADGRRPPGRGPAREAAPGAVRGPVVALTGRADSGAPACATGAPLSSLGEGAAGCWQGDT